LGFWVWGVGCGLDLEAVVVLVRPEERHVPVRPVDLQEVDVVRLRPRKRIRKRIRYLSGFRVRVSNPGFGSQVSGSGFQVQGFGFRVSDFGFRVSGHRSRVPGFRFRVSGSGFRVPGSGFRVSGFGFQVPGVGCGV